MTLFEFKRGSKAYFSVKVALIGGVYFPVTIMPVWLQFVAKFLPITYAIRAIQLAVYKGFGLSQLYKEIGFLLLFSCFLLPLGFASFKYALKKARHQGSLLQY
jgi:ABC-2 type transport system permease protein